MYTQRFVSEATSLSMPSINSLNVAGHIAIDVPADKAIAVLHNLKHNERDDL